MIVVDGSTVRDLLPMADAIALMRDAFAAYAAGSVHQPLRTVVNPPDLDGLSVVMPAHVSDAYAMKVVSVFEGNAARGLDAVQGFVAVIDHETGVLAAVLDAASVTAIRTAAVSGLATHQLARPDATDVAILGAGVQGRAHVDAMRAVRDVRRVRVWNRTPGRGDDLGEVCSTAEEAVRGADIVCTCTSSASPVLSGEWLSEGMHINAVGAFSPATRELDSSAIAKSVVFVDSRQSAMAEAGELLIPLAAGEIPADHIAAELGDVVAGDHPGRRSPEDITVFKSLGLAIEDAMAAAHVVREARRHGRGTEVAFP